MTSVGDTMGDSRGKQLWQKAKNEHTRMKEEGSDPVDGSGKKPEKPSLWQLVKDQAANTGVQGVPNIQRSQSMFRKCFWGLVVIGGTAMMLWQISEAVMKFYSYPSDTTVDLQYSPALSFPAVTICNLNPVRISSLGEAGSEIETLFTDNEVENDTKPDTFFDWDSADDADDYYETESSEFQAFEQYLYLTSEMTRSERQKVGHNITWMLLDCSWQGKPCSPKNFTLFSNYMFGNCYTFNLDGELAVNKVGPLYGLALELYIEQAEYIDGLADAAGMRVVIHNQTDMPFPEDEGFSIAPGFKTSVGLQRTDITRAKPPYGKCKNHTASENEQRNAFLYDISSIGYTASACKKTCYQRHLLRDCGCYDSKVPFNSTIVAYSDILASHTQSAFYSCDKETSNEECVENVTSSFVQDKLGCSSVCPPACTAVVYKPVMSYAAWPAAVIEEEVLDQLLEYDESIWDMLDALDESAQNTYVKDNMVKLEVYYSDLNYETIVTKASYKITDLLSDLGGQAGLWLGVSIIALFEFVELMFDIAKVVGGGRKRNSPNVEPERSEKDAASPLTTSKITMHGESADGQGLSDV